MFRMRLRCAWQNQQPGYQPPQSGLQIDMKTLLMPPFVVPAAQLTAGNYTLVMITHMLFQEALKLEYRGRNGND
eukprot:884648-Amphidinium_carterae.1